MKKLIHLLLTLAMLAGFGYVLKLGLHHQQAKEEEAAHESAPHEEEAKAEPFIVALEKERAEALGVATAKPAKHESAPRRMALATVIDPAPLIAIDGEVSLAEAALKTSQAVNQRNQALAAANDGPLKNAEASEAEYRANEIKLSTLIRSAQLQWGDAFQSDAKQRHEFIDKLAKGSIAFVRADVMPGDPMETPTGASLAVIGHEAQPIHTSHVSVALTADAKTQAQGFMLRVDDPPFALRPGMAATAWLELPGKAREGIVVPRAAVLRHDGRTWVYVKAEDEEFERKPVTLGEPLDGGIFIAEDGGLEADDEIVIVGAASLLSEELKGGGEPE
jgi:multidrug efflux pump subunit AcrA (membrane-fusion protein)